MYNYLVSLFSNPLRINHADILPAYLNNYLFFFLHWFGVLVGGYFYVEHWIAETLNSPTCMGFDNKQRNADVLSEEEQEGLDKLILGILCF